MFIPARGERATVSQTAVTLGRPMHVRQTQPEAQAARTASPITVGLVSVAANADGTSVFSLANGQVWQAEDDDPVFPDASGNTVTLSKSLLGRD